MARITVEDCLHNVENRFHLVLLAAKRARQLMRGSVEPTVPWENDKATVVALREIANGHTDFSDAHHATPLTIAPPLFTLPENEIPDASREATTGKNDNNIAETHSESTLSHTKTPETPLTDDNN